MIEENHFGVLTKLKSKKIQQHFQGKNLVNYENLLKLSGSETNLIGLGLCVCVCVCGVCGHTINNKVGRLIERRVIQCEYLVQEEGGKEMKV